MTFFKKFIPVAIIIATLMSLSIPASAANIDLAQTNAVSEQSLLAADFDVTGTTLSASSALPSSYSSRALGYATAVRTQIYNTCWAYGSLATLESIMLKDGYSVSHFAPMHMNHWGTLRADGTGWDRDATSGGYSYISLGYLTSWQGPRLESAYPEKTSLSSFSTYDATASKQVAVNGIIYLDTDDLSTIKTAVYEYGAVVGNYHVDNNKYNGETYAYYCDTQGLATSQLNGHCISIVGWDDNFSKENFNLDARPSSNGAWLCKNSWGSYWGDDGYYWISYEDEYLFDKRFGYSYTFTDYEPYDSLKTLYQNEIDGATYEFSYTSGYNPVTYINVFDTDDTFSLIEKVNFESTAQGASYTIYSIPVGSNGVPLKQESRWTKIASGTLEYKGYHSIDTDDFVVTDDQFAIGVQISKKNGSGNSIGVDEWLTTGNEYIFTPQSDYGMSYIKIGSLYFMDVMDFYYDYCGEDEIGGTFVIKAVGATRIVQGDADLDGTLTIMDATCIQRYLAQLSTLTSEQLSFADYDKDEIVSILDATLIQFALAGTSSEFVDFE